VWRFFDWEFPGMSGFPGTDGRHASRSCSSRACPHPRSTRNHSAQAVPGSGFPVPGSGPTREPPSATQTLELRASGARASNSGPTRNSEHGTRNPTQARPAAGPKVTHEGDASRLGAKSVSAKRAKRAKRAKILPFPAFSAQTRRTSTIRAARGGFPASLNWPRITILSEQEQEERTEKE